MLDNDFKKEYIFLNTEIKKRYGFITRARGHYLYTEKNVRLTDLFLENGRAFLGWGNLASQSMLVLKNTSSRGQTGSFFSHHEDRLKKIVFELYPNYTDLYFFLTRESLFAHLLEKKLVDFNLAELGEQKLLACNIPVVRPGQAVSETYSPKIANTLIVIPPFSWAQSPYLVLHAEQNSMHSLQKSYSDFISPALFAALTRGFYDLKKKLTLPLADFSVFDSIFSPYFTRTAQYLYYAQNPKIYRDFMLHCLDCHIVLPPLCTLPAILSYSVQKSDFKLFEKNSFSSTLLKTGLQKNIAEECHA